MKDRIFSEDQILVILREIITFHSAKGKTYKNDLSGFGDHLKPKIIPCQPTEAQVKEKIMNLRKKYKKVTSFVTRGENGEDESVYRQDFQLWERIWGDDGILAYKRRD